MICRMSMEIWKKHIKAQLTKSLGYGGHRSISFPRSWFYCYEDAWSRRFRIWEKICIVNYSKENILMVTPALPSFVKLIFTNIWIVQNIFYQLRFYLHFHLALNLLKWTIFWDFSSHIAHVLFLLQHMIKCFLALYKVNLGALESGPNPILCINAYITYLQ